MRREDATEDQGGRRGVGEVEGERYGGVRREEVEVEMAKRRERGERKKRREEEEQGGRGEEGGRGIA